ncbi:MAG: NUDIX hydrolase [Eubacteriales bacterium]|nr:NUDIX hydrolase [Eubacteriales bacterium]
MTFEEKTLSSEIIYKGSIINLRKDKVSVKNGTSFREIVEHGGGSVLAALDENNNMIMVKQFRKPLNRVVLEAPAGKIDPGEDPLETAMRELKEETGYTAAKVSFLTKIYPSVGYSEEALYLYLCQELSGGEPCFDENEALDIEKYSIDELYRMVMSGEINDAKTIIIVLFIRNLQLEGKLL